MPTSTYQYVKTFKEDIVDAIRDITEAHGGDVPMDYWEDGHHFQYTKGMGKGRSFYAAGQLHRHCRTKGHTDHAWSKSPVGERMRSDMMQYLILLRAMHDMFPGGKYNPQDPARDGDVSQVIAILRQVLTRVKIAFENYETTNVFVDPDFSFASIPPGLPGVSSLPSVGASPPPVPSPPPSTQPRPDHEWFFSPEKPPRTTYRHRARQGTSRANRTKTSKASTAPSTLTPANRADLDSATSSSAESLTSSSRKRFEELPAKRKQTSQTSTALFTPSYQLLTPANRADLGSATSSSTKSLTSSSRKRFEDLATKRKRGVESEEHTPSRPPKKLRDLGTLDISDDEADQGVGSSSMRKGKGKMKALDLGSKNDASSPVRKGRRILSDIVLAADSEGEEDDVSSPLKPLSF
ncbi:hypothetical protein AAF712_013547 [Marasmius tenuissimus]|uniref:Uncharacterized protein n=1 Tax=Marasmius tenuissimus TaxID=585030 RepID=A0ABR2ZGW6_9AGAR